MWAHLELFTLQNKMLLPLSYSFGYSIKLRMQGEWVAAGVQGTVPAVRLNWSCSWRMWWLGPSEKQIRVNQPQPNKKQKRNLLETVSWQSLRIGCEATNRKFWFPSQRERLGNAARQNGVSGEVLEQSSPVPASVEGGRNPGALLPPRGHCSCPCPWRQSGCQVASACSHPGQSGPWNSVGPQIGEYLLGRAAHVRHSSWKLPV